MIKNNDYNRPNIQYRPATNITDVMIKLQIARGGRMETLLVDALPEASGRIH